MMTVEKFRGLADRQVIIRRKLDGTRMRLTGRIITTIQAEAISMVSGSTFWLTHEQVEDQKLPTEPEFRAHDHPEPKE